MIKESSRYLWMTMGQIFEDNDEEDGEEVTYQGDDNGAIMFVRVIGLTWGRVSESYET